MWGSVVGGVIGGILGGPIGAGIGAAAGAAIGGSGNSSSDGNWDGEDYTQGLPGLDAELRFQDDHMGRLLFVSGPSIIEGAIVVLSARGDDGSYRRSFVPQLADDDGDLLVYRFVEGGEAVFWLPFAAVEPLERGRMNFGIRVLITDGEDTQVLGEDFYSTDWKWQDLCLADFWQPFIGICMHVARCDGHLDRSEVRTIRELLEEGLQLPTSERPRIKELMKQEPSAPLAELVQTLMVRAPWVEPQAIVEAMVDVALADGIVHPNEVSAVREVTELFGVGDEEWLELAEHYGLDVADKLRQHRDILGVGSDASAAEIKAAWRARVQEYHPDKHSSLPKEFRDLAREMTKKINEAKAALLQQPST